MSQMTFRQLVTSNRDKRGWTQEKLANALGCTVKAIANVENGRSGRLQKNVWPKLADTFDISIEEITSATSGKRKASELREAVNAAITSQGETAVIQALRRLAETGNPDKQVKVVVQPTQKKREASEVKPK